MKKVCGIGNMKSLHHIGEGTVTVLCNLVETDPGEWKNVAAANPEVVETLRRLHRKWTENGFKLDGN